MYLNAQRGRSPSLPLRGHGIYLTYMQFRWERIFRPLFSCPAQEDRRIVTVKQPDGGCKVRYTHGSWPHVRSKVCIRRNHFNNTRTPYIYLYRARLPGLIQWMCRWGAKREPCMARMFGRRLIVD